MESPIHIAFCVNDTYVKYICVTIKSIVENHQGHNIHFHILTDYITKKNKEKLKRISSPHSCAIYEIDDSRLQGLKVGCYTKYTWYRIFLPEIISKEIKRVLYLDADTVVAADISNLFEMDITNVSVAAAQDDWNHVKDDSFFERLKIKNPTKYFCAGILLMNLEFWREHNLIMKILSWARENNDKLLFPDQDALNHVCQDSLLLLPRSYDVTFFQFLDDYFYNEGLSELKESLYDPKIIHYCVTLPWKYDSTHPFTFLWRKYNKMLGRHRVRIEYDVKISNILKWKNKVWHILHPSYYNGYFESFKRRVENK